MEENKRITGDLLDEPILRKVLEIGIQVGKRQAAEEDWLANEAVNKRILRAKETPIPMCPDHPAFPLLRAGQCDCRGFWWYCPRCRSQMISQALANRRERFSPASRLRRVRLVELEEMDTVEVPVVL